MIDTVRLWIILGLVGLLMLIILAGCSEVGPNSITVGTVRDQSWHTEGEVFYGLHIEATWQLK